MANRAYLYSSNRRDDWECPERDYYDSRHTIPLAWFFFFRPDDIRIVDVRDGGSQWQEVKLSAEKQNSLDLFAARQPLLRLLVEDGVTREKTAHFLATIERRPGRFLLMEPREVLDGIGYDDEVDAQIFMRILQLLDSDEASPDAVRQTMQPFVGTLSSDLDRRECQVIGYTYLWDLGDAGTRL